MQAFNESSKIPYTNSILVRGHNLATRHQYEELVAASNARLAKQTNIASTKPVDTIDLCDDTENVPANSLELTPSTAFLSTSYTGRRKSDFNFKKPSAYVDLDDDDDEVNQTHFTRSPGFSSTQIIKSKDLDRSPAISSNVTTNKQKYQSPSQSSLSFRDVPHINSLKEKHSTKDSLRDDHLEKILSRHNQKQAEKNKTIEEEEKK